MQYDLSEQKKGNFEENRCQYRIIRNNPPIYKVEYIFLQQFTE